MTLLLTTCAEEAATPIDDGKVSMASYADDDQRASSEALLVAAAIDPAPVHQSFAFDDFRTRTGDGNTLTAPFDTQQLLAIASAGGWPSLGDSAGAETTA